MANDFMTNLITMLAQYQEKNPKNKVTNAGIGNLIEMIQKLQGYGTKVQGLMSAPPTPEMTGTGYVRRGLEAELERQRKLKQIMNAQ